MNNTTNLLLKNKNELFENQRKIISLEQKRKKKKYVKKINLIFNKNNYQSKTLINKNIIIKLQEKIKQIDPWYKKICELKNLTGNLKKLAMHTSYKNTSTCWYIYLNDKKKHLIQNNAWLTFKKELHKITEKDIRLIIEKKKINILTPYEWFHKIYQEGIFKEYLLLQQDPNIEVLKKFFNIDFAKHNINLI
ncbi:DNA polymerase III subunit gamma/tau C-terminal domain-containing protein [Buchnera aphidicola]|uniref:DNA polymerase III tau subunit domain-containing protein n=1 Tax=Buchnera aphidicola (Macrosiphum gaurae) TaxID=2315801 RepID=A0A4D6Y9X0_9GAMM|nr:DNA polymerase III subunit gamma/tau C-terminal domain-containing protein [Buchnera aphidicola]QCI22914.1 hypothetical protein D9V72_02445 [Buchnera aphidicola (Macrosiphum gaurae)]